MKNIIINTSIQINKLEDLQKLRDVMEANNLSKPNFSKIAKDLGVDRRTVKKYYEKDNKKDRKVKKCKTDACIEIIDNLLFSNEGIKQIFYYKNHLYAIL